MKKILFLILNLSIFTSAFAQISLEYPGSAPEIGDISELIYFSNQGHSHEPSGADVVWDFSDLSELGNGSILVIDPANAPFSGNFPDADFAYNQNDTLYTFCELDAASLNYLGYHLISPQLEATFIYHDQIKFIEYPFTYNNSFIDKFAGTASVSFAEIRSTGDRTVHADAFGTLVLPTGTYSDVLRIATTENEVDSVFVNGIPLKLEFLSRIQYLWYDKYSPLPIMVMEYIDLTGVKDTLCYYSTTGVGLYDQTDKVLSEPKVFPNPANKELSISFESNSNQNISINIVNLIGQMQFSKNAEISTGINKLQIDIGNLPEGIYFIRLNSESGMHFSNKFIKQ